MGELCPDQQSQTHQSSSNSITIASFPSEYLTLAELIKSSSLEVFSNFRNTLTEKNQAKTEKN